MERLVKVSGTGTVGSYSYQVSNDGVKYTEVESKSAEGNFPETSGALFHQVVLKTLPQSGTVVRVCIYGATVADGARQTNLTRGRVALTARMAYSDVRV